MHTKSKNSTRENIEIKLAQQHRNVTQIHVYISHGSKRDIPAVIWDFLNQILYLIITWLCR